MDGYCFLMVHLLRGRELGFRNVFTDKIRQCSKHRRWQTCENIGVYDHRFNECRLLYFVTCQGAIRAINDRLYNKTTTHAHESLQSIYTLHVIKLSNDIYIEMRKDIRRPSNDYRCKKNNFQFGYTTGKYGVGNIAKCEMGVIN